MPAWEHSGLVPLPLFSLNHIKAYYQKTLLMASENEKSGSELPGWARKKISPAPPPTSCFIRHFPRSVSSAMAEGVTSVAIISSSVSRDQNVKLHPFRTETVLSDRSPQSKGEVSILG